MPTFEAIQSEIDTLLDINQEELTEEQRQALDAYLDELASKEAEKVDGFGQWMKLESARVDALKEESKRLAAKAKSAENKISYLKHFYLSKMQERGLKKIQGEVYKLSVTEREAVSVTVQAEALPPEYIREKITREPDKTAIKDALKSGAKIEGCEIVPSYSLRVA